MSEILKIISRSKIIVPRSSPAWERVRAVLRSADYPFSSFHAIWAEKRRDELAEQFRKYPDYKELVLSEKEDDF